MSSSERGDYRGAVRPPFIEGSHSPNGISKAACYRGAVRPPFIEGSHCSLAKIATFLLSGGSPPPLH